MRVRDLGALTVAVGTTEQPIVGAKAAAMLARLAINANERVSTDQLMEAAWGEHITDGAASTLTSHIWRLRQVLEPDRDRRSPASVLVNDSEGYRLVCSAATLDSLMLIEAGNEVRDLLAAGDADSAVRRADAALALWRGTPYGTVSEAAWAQASVARLEELRGQLLERRIEGLLACGAADAALSDLHPLIAAMPFRQSLRGLQMQALHRSGRSEQALQVYQQTRRLLVDEVGIEPGADLAQLHRRILDNDAALVPAKSPAATSRRPVAVQLPHTLSPLVGRARVLGELTKLIQSHRLVTIIGAAGCGKTRVAVEAARAAAAQFPDGVWFVDLTAVSDPALVAEAIVSTVGIAGSAGATALQDLRRYLQTRRLLLVLDNCEHVLDGVDAFVRVTLGDPDVNAECRLLATSREPIGIDGETTWTLAPLDLPGDDSSGDHAPAAAVELFLQRLTAAAPTLVVDEQVRSLAADIAVAVDGLPLPLELAAARALSYSLEDIAAQVTLDPGRLGRLGRAGRPPQDHRATVRSAIEWSHRLLSEAEQRAHRRLSVLPGAFSIEAAAAVLEDQTPGAPGESDDLLAQLVYRSMLVSQGAFGHGRHTGFRQLATVRSHARHALATAGETTERLDRRDRWVGDLVAARPPLGTAAEVDWYRRLDDDYDTVRATLTRQLIDEPDPAGSTTAGRLTHYWYNRERLVEAGRWLQLAYDSAPDDSSADALLARIWLSCVQTMQRRPDLARPHVAEAEARVRDTAPERLVEVGEGLVVLAMGMYVCEQPQTLGELHRLLRWVGDAAGDANLDLLVDAVGCCAELVAGQLRTATELAFSVQERAEQQGNLMASYVSTAPLIVGAMHARRPEDGLPWIDHCLKTHLRLGTGAVGMFLETRANFTAQAADFVDAARTYSASRTVTRRAGLAWPNRSWTEDLLELTRRSLGASSYERAWHDGERLTPADVVGPVTEAPTTSGVTQPSVP